MKKSMSLKIFGIFSILFIVFYTYNTLASTSNNSCYAFKSCSHKQLTYDNFMKIKIGSNYNNVINILGEESYKNCKFIEGNKDTIYVWKLDNTDKTIFITFRNGIVVTKEQYQLANIIATDSSDNIKALKHGMSYEYIKSLLGEGTLISESNYTKVYRWTYSSSISINCTFNKNALSFFVEN